MSIVKTLPHWDMTPIYPGMDSPEFSNGFSNVVRDIENLTKLFDDYHIMKLSTEPALDQDMIQAFETVIAQYNTVLEATETLAVYIMCFVTTNSYDTLAQAKLSELQQSMLILSQLGTRLTAWIGSLNVEVLIERSPTAREHAFMLRKAKISAEHLMAPDEENLASELNLSAGTAWEKLHSDVTSQLMVSLELSGQKQELPMSMVRNLASDPDREVRRSAYEAELEGWKQVALPLAAAMNSIKGEVNVLARRRGWSSPLDASLLDNNIDRITFDAMLAAAYELFPDFRRYLNAKARVLGLPRLAWYDIFAPVSSTEKVWEYPDASNFIIEQFGSFSPRLSSFAARAFRENWIDAEPREGKVDGAYCTPLRGDESRVFANYKASYDGVSTLAHELGHGYHNLNLAQRTMLQRSTPMTLAETASIFCETIIRNAAMQNAGRQEQIAILGSITSEFMPGCRGHHQPLSF